MQGPQMPHQSILLSLFNVGSVFTAYIVFLFLSNQVAHCVMKAIQKPDKIEVGIAKKGTSAVDMAEEGIECGRHGRGRNRMRWASRRKAQNAVGMVEEGTNCGGDKRPKANTVAMCVHGQAHSGRMPCLDKYVWVHPRVETGFPQRTLRRPDRSSWLATENGAASFWSSIFWSSTQHIWSCGMSAAPPSQTVPLRLLLPFPSLQITVQPIKQCTVPPWKLEAAAPTRRKE
eukprot:856172-Pelagomonas_calceolata.AAC.7